MISQQEALRQRGYSDEEIDQILQEQKDAEPEEVGTFGPGLAALPAAIPLDGRIDTNRK